MGEGVDGQKRADDRERTRRYLYLLHDLAEVLPGTWAVRGRASRGALLVRQPIGWTLTWIGFEQSGHAGTGYLIAAVRPLVDAGSLLHRAYGIRHDEFGRLPHTLDLRDPHLVRLGRTFAFAALGMLERYSPQRLAAAAEATLAAPLAERLRRRPVGAWPSAAGFRVVFGTGSPERPARDAMELSRHIHGAKSGGDAKLAFYGGLIEAWHAGGRDAALTYLEEHRAAMLQAIGLNRGRPRRPAPDGPLAPGPTWSGLESGLATELARMSPGTTATVAEWLPATHGDEPYPQPRGVRVASDATGFYAELPADGFLLEDRRIGADGAARLSADGWAAPGTPGQHWPAWTRRADRSATTDLATRIVTALRDVYRITDPAALGYRAWQGSDERRIVLPDLGLYERGYEASAEEIARNHLVGAYEGEEYWAETTPDGVSLWGWHATLAQRGFTVGQRRVRTSLRFQRLVPAADLRAVSTVGRYRGRERIVLGRRHSTVRLAPDTTDPTDTVDALELHDVRERSDPPGPRTAPDHGR